MTGRRNKIQVAAILVLVACSGGTDRLWAGSVTTEVKNTVENVVGVLKDPRLQLDAKKKERRERLRQIIGARFDFEEMARRSLGQHWQRHAARKQEFVPVFTNFVEGSYVGQIETYRNEKILYTRERLENNFAQVDTKVLRSDGEEIPINYKLHLVGGQWKIYDVLIENISLVNNYRSQFHRILSTASFDDLIKRLQEKAPEAGRVGL
ncbi:MAG: ABC transporter substrate-binding protein [Deltaproteobacteria bacterium]|nr:ABC transporter substrate-binding protein [Deltaproteobacteria bacterium]